jgi:mono/diheme cytochrome c family protein
MSRTPFIVFGIFAAVCLLVLPWMALGREGSDDAATVHVEAADEGAKQLFFDNCGSCHTLAAAGTDGVVGPNLDQLLLPSGTNSAEAYSGSYGRVLQAVTCGIQGRMPKGILLGEEANEVAAFVAAYAGQIDKGPVVDLASADKRDPGPCSTGGS